MRPEGGEGGDRHYTQLSAGHSCACCATWISSGEFAAVGSPDARAPNHAPALHDVSVELLGFYRSHPHATHLALIFSQGLFTCIAASDLYQRLLVPGSRIAGLHWRSHSLMFAMHLLVTFACAKFSSRMRALAKAAREAKEEAAR